MTKRVIRTALTASVASLAAVATLAGGMTASAATAEFPQNRPDITSLLGEFYDWWTPVTIADSGNKNPDDPTSNTPQGSAFRGSVTDRGADVLKRNDETVVAINNKAYDDNENGVTVDGTHTQAQRAGMDAVDNDAFREFSDALGTTIAGFVKDGLESGRLPLTDELVFDNGSSLSFPSFVGTGSAKTDFNYPRPYTNKALDGWDRTFDGANDLNGLDAELGIKRIPMFTQDGVEYGDDYTDVTEPSQAFPSGHTTKAYNRGLGLATLLPELGTDLVTRSSEAGNNRIVLGVHYPLDVMGGRIAASADVAALWSDEDFRNDVLLPAHEELEGYLAERCGQAGLGDTVAECVAATRADGEGYRNSFTDAVSTKPVTDRASMIDAYTARMTYGFAQTGQAGQAARVPDGASNLLFTAFPDLTDEQRAQILAASEIDSGYPLDATSEGYQRINLAKAFSAKVTLSADRSTIVAIEFGADAPTVVVQSDDVQQGDDSDRPSTTPDAGQDDQQQNDAPTVGDAADDGDAPASATGASGSSTSMARTGADVAAGVVFTALVACAGLALAVTRRRRS